MSGLGMCETPGCKSIAKLQCPTCIKIGIPGSFFCSQECFKGSWKNHKIIHNIARKQIENVYNIEFNYKEQWHV